MKKLVGTLMIIVALTACNSSSSTESKGEQAADTTEIRPTNPATENDAATHSQVIPRDSVETSADSTGNIKPGDTTKRK
jgi:hypothetical protein